MKTTTRIIGLVLIVIFCSFATDWIAFANKAGRFKILFPRQPQVSEDTVDTEIGKLKMKTFMYEVGKYKDDNAMYGVIYSDYPDSLINSEFKDELVNDFFTNAISGAVNNVKGTVISEKKITIKGFPGRFVKISFLDGQGILDVQIYLVKNRMYMLQVGCEKEKDNNPAIDKFLNSFELTEIKK